MCGYQCTYIQIQTRDINLGIHSRFFSMKQPEGRASQVRFLFPKIKTLHNFYCGVLESGMIKVLNLMLSVGIQCFPVEERRDL